MLEKKTVFGLNLIQPWKFHFSILRVNGQVLKVRRVSEKHGVHSHNYPNCLSPSSSCSSYNIFFFLVYYVRVSLKKTNMVWFVRKNQ
ncbi:uncharacterized protein DS421_6g184530 [Arachis hypogaea]|nr:uncharacterized protein DS421_6g184530 [Arachis hypogaea]